jgi:membrane protease YdiL (CAAX protease family)
VRDLAQLTPDFTTETAADPWHMQMLLNVVNPAIIEEIAFRGIIFGALLRSLRGWETVVVTALMFMVLHLNVPTFPHLLLGGICFGVLRLKSGSWLPGVFMHFMHNFLATVMP